MRPSDRRNGHRATRTTQPLANGRSDHDPALRAARSAQLPHARLGAHARDPRSRCGADRLLAAAQTERHRYGAPRERRRLAAPGRRAAGRDAAAQLRQPARLGRAQGRTSHGGTSATGQRRTGCAEHDVSSIRSRAAAARAPAGCSSCTGTRARRRFASPTTPSSPRGPSRETCPGRSCTPASATPWSSR